MEKVARKAEVVALPLNENSEDLMPSTEEILLQEDIDGSGQDLLSDPLLDQIGQVQAYSTSVKPDVSPTRAADEFQKEPQKKEERQPDESFSTQLPPKLNNTVKGEGLFFSSNKNTHFQ